MRFLRRARRRVATIAVVLLCLACPFFAHPAAMDPSSFNTTAKFSIDDDSRTLSTAVATIEPRRGAPGYSWLRIHFYSFPVTAGDIPGILDGDIQSMDTKWKNMAGHPSGYNHANAVIQLSVDGNFKVWQVDMVVPGHTCTIAPFEQDVRNFLQDYSFDGNRLKLKSTGSYVCDMKFMGIPNQTFGWDLNLNLPVFEKRIPKP